MKVKELPYKQGEDAAYQGLSTKCNPYWDDYDKGGMEWAFHSWLSGWSDVMNAKKIAQRTQKENSGTTTQSK